MTEKLVLAAVTLWVTVYTLSYGLYEYKSGSKMAATGIVVLCLAIFALFAKI